MIVVLYIYLIFLICYIFYTGTVILILTSLIRELYKDTRHSQIRLGRKGFKLIIHFFSWCCHNIVNLISYSWLFIAQTNYAGVFFLLVLFLNTLKIKYWKIVTSIKKFIIFKWKLYKFHKIKYSLNTNF